MTTTIRPCTAADLPFACGLLRAAGLPMSDLDVDRLAYAAEEQGELRGVIGRELCGDVALLRSLIVDRRARGTGLATRLVEVLEADCRALGVAEMWLLTIDAEGYFENLGYAIRERQDAPDSIRSTEEFASLCPGNAIVMSKAL